MKRTLAVLLVAGAAALTACEEDPRARDAAASGPYVVDGWVSEVGFDRVEVQTQDGTAELQWPARVPAIDEGREVHRAELQDGTPVRASFVVDENGDARAIAIEVQPYAGGALEEPTVVPQR